MRFNLPAGWDKQLINVILVAYMCYALTVGIKLDQMFWTIIFFQLGIRAGSSGNDATQDKNKKLAEENESLRVQNAKLADVNGQLTIQSMKAGKPVPITSPNE